jgi:uncharacterized protein YecE (DUF72 family)
VWCDTFRLDILGSMVPRITIGTSGWQYKDWNGLFYPDTIKGTAQLPYFAAHFKSVEINSTFYHMPRRSSVENWAASVPDDFQFAIKMNRFLTHTKRLTSDDQFTDTLHEFLYVLEPLGTKLAAVLVQLPPSMHVADSRLEYLAEQVKLAEQRLHMRLPLAIEFRHSSWFNPTTSAVMRDKNLATVINDSPDRWPAAKIVTGDLAYIRFHGSQQLYRSSYTKDEHANWVEFIKTTCAPCTRILCYFNNDYNGVAVQNAKMLQEMIIDSGMAD